MAVNGGVSISSKGGIARNVLDQERCSTRKKKGRDCIGRQRTVADPPSSPDHFQPSRHIPEVTATLRRERVRFSRA